jgi:hypothetical protein
MAMPTKPDSRLGTYSSRLSRTSASGRATAVAPHPPLVLQPLLPLLEQANQALGRLDGLVSILPGPALFERKSHFLRK